MNCELSTSILFILTEFGCIPGLHNIYSEKARRLTDAIFIDLILKYCTY